MGKGKRSADAANAATHSANSLFIRNLPPSAEESDLQAHFGGIGPLRTTTVVRDSETGKSRRFAFVRYAIVEHAAEALKSLNGSMLKGRCLNVTYALPRNRQSKNDKSGDKKQSDADGDDDDDDENDYEKKTYKTSLNKQKSKQMTPNQYTGLRGKIAMRTIIITRSDSQTMTESDVQALFQSSSDSSTASTKQKLDPQAVVLCAGGRHARVTFDNWSKAGLAAAHVHAKQGYKAVIDALQNGDRTKVIVRNLPFRISPADIRKQFSELAKKPIRCIHFPKNATKADEEATATVNVNDPDESKSRDCPGFAFVEFFTVADTNFAMQKVNGADIGGRTVAVDLAVGKVTHRKKVEEAEQDDEEEEEETNGAKAKNDEADADTDENDDDINDNDSDGSDDDGGGKNKEEKEDGDSENEPDGSDENDNEDEDEISSGNAKQSKSEKDSARKDSSSSSEELERTVFVRNLLYECTGSEVWKVMAKRFGKVEQAVIVKNRATGQSRGCAFVRFKSADDALKAIASCRDAEKPINEMAYGEDEESVYDNEVWIRGRKVIIVPAVDRTRMPEVKASNEQGNSNKQADPRNLRLAYVGKIDPDSEEGRKLSPDDLFKRSKAETDKRTKLSRNPNSYVSDVRLSVRNIPRGLDEKALKGMFEVAVSRPADKPKKGKGRGDGNDDGDDEQGPSKKGNNALDIIPPSGKVKHCNVVKDPERPGRSLGFGFVTFVEHSDAWNALFATNNKPNALNYLIEWAEIERRRRLHIKNRRLQKSKAKKNGKRNKNNDAGDDDEAELFNLTESYIREMWGKGRRLIVEFSVEDKRQVRVLERVKERGAELRKEHRQKLKKGEANGKDAGSKNANHKQKEGRRQKNKRPFDEIEHEIYHGHNGRAAGNDNEDWDMDIEELKDGQALAEAGDADGVEEAGHNAQPHEEGKPKGKKRKKSHETAAHARRRERRKMGKRKW